MLCWLFVYLWSCKWNKNINCLICLSWDCGTPNKAYRTECYICSYIIIASFYKRKKGAVTLSITTLSITMLCLVLSVVMLNVEFYLLLCWVSLCWISLCWVSWHRKKYFLWKKFKMMLVIYKLSGCHSVLARMIRLTILVET